MQSEKFSTAEYFRLVDDLRTLGKLDNDDSIVGLSSRLHNGFYANPADALSVSFIQGPIPSAIVGEGEQPIRETVTGLQGELQQAVQALNKLLEAGFEWPKSLPKLAVALTAVDSYVQWLETSVQALDIAGPLKAAALQQLDTQYTKIRPSLVAITSGVDNAKSLLQSITAVQKGVKALGITLNSADTEQLNEAAALAKQLSVMSSSQDALSVIITVWNMTPASQREAVFKKVSEELYNFLAGKSQDDLNCLAQSVCLNPVLGVEKLAVFGQLENYGIQKIHDQIDSAARAQVMATVSAQAIREMNQLPSQIRSTVSTQAAPYFALIKKVLADVPGFTNSHVKAWATAHFKQPLRGLETGAVVATLKNGSVSVGPAGVANGSVVATGAESIGASLAVAQEFLPFDNPSAMEASLFSSLQEELAIGGFRQASGKPFPGMLLPLTGSLAQVFSLESLGNSSVPFVVADSFQMNSAFQMDRQHAVRNAGVGAQAELLKGLARQILFYRDWEQDEYDVSLGKILVQDLVPEMPQGLVDAPFLPKVAPLALSLAETGTLLENFQLGLSPLFSVAADGSVSWGLGERVGLVSIMNGQRDTKVQSGATARMILALDELLAATQGIEGSSAIFLKTKTRDGQSTLLADIQEYRKQLSALELGLAQLLAQKEVQSDGSVVAELTVGARLAAVAGPRSLEDQALAIRALIAAGKGSGELKEAALGIYEGMNRNFGSSGFYAGEIDKDGKAMRKASLRETVLTLLAGEELADSMSADARAQWSKLAGSWKKALDEAAGSL
jgi:hypothetical protein